VTSQRLLSLHRYPIKACHGHDLTTATVGPLGLDGDRRWMITDADGTFITQRQLPALARLQPTITADGLHLRGGNGETIEVRQPSTDAATLTVQVWRSTVTAPLAAAPVHAWLSRQLDRECRLVYMPDDLVRTTNPDYSRPGDRVSFADGYPLLLTTQASLDRLNGELEAPVPMERFRPNLVVTGSEPFAEETWQQITIGGTVFDVVKPCERCVVITVDQQTGVLTGKEPLRTLARLRAPGKVIFGVNLIPRQLGTLSAGDTVTCR
jgi:uncharacterized protein YcbX